MARIDTSPIRMAALVFAIGLAITAAVLALLAERDRERLRVEHRAEARELAERVAERINDAEVRFREIDNLGALVDLANPATFAAFAAPILAESPSFQVLEWVTEVAHGQRAAVEAELSALAGRDTPLREIGVAGPSLARERPSYVVVRRIEPMLGNEAALGLDLGSERARARALERAWQAGKAEATAPVRLVQRPEHLSYLVFVPVRRDARREFLLAVLKPAALLTRGAEVNPESHLSMQVSDVTEPGRPVLLTDPDTDGKRPIKALTTRRVDLAGRSIEIVISAAEPGSGPWSRQLWPALVGLLLSAAMAGVVALLLGRNAEIGRLVGERTARLQEQQERALQMFMAAPDATIIVDPQGRIEDANVHAETLFGRPHDELLQCTVEDLMPARYRAGHRLQRKDYGESPRFGVIQPMYERGQFFVLRADGREVPVAIGISPLTHGGQRRLIVALSDLSSQVALTAKLRRERDLRQQSLDALNNVLVALDVEGRVTMINRFGCEFLERREDQILGLAWFASFSPAPEKADADYRRIVERLANRAASFEQVRASVIGGDGRLHTLDWRVTALWDADAHCVGCLASGLDVTEQLAAETAAIRFGSDLEATLNALPDLLLEFDADGRYLHVHTARDDLLALPREQMLGRTVREVVPAEAAEQLMQVIGRALRDGRADAELMRYQINEEMHWADISASRKVAPDGQLSCIVLVRDATNRMLARRQADHMRAIVLASGELLAYIGIDGRIEVANPAFARIFGSPSSDIAGMVLAEMVGEAVFGALEAALAEGFKGLTVRLPLEVGQGERSRTLEIEIAPLRQDGAVNGVVMSGHDITDRASAQLALEAYRDNLEEEVGERTAALEHIRARLAHTLESNPVPTFVLDADGRVSHWNTACAVYFGLSEAEMLGRTELWRAFYNEERPVMAQVLMRGDKQELSRLYRGSCRPSALVPGAYEAEAYFPKLDRWLFFTAAPMLDPDGNCIGAIETLQDVTARKEAEAMMLQAQHAAEAAARAKSEFLANMSHEIRTPLNGVIGLSQVGVRENAGRRAHHTFEKIHQSAVHLLGLINDLLDFSKIESGKFELESAPFCLAEYIDRALDITAPTALAKGIQMLVSEPPDLPREVSGDGLRLAQCLVNLLGNAIKFTETGWVRLDVGLQGDTLSLAVRDSGIGMSPAQMSRLFKPFEQADGSTTRRFGGTGLGLAITQQIALMMGGEVAVTSTLDQGSCFELRVPLKVVTPHDAQRRGLPAGVVLVGLPEREQSLVAAQLESWGCRCRQASLGELTLEPGEVLAANSEVLAEAIEAGVPESALVTIHDPGPTPRIGAVHWMRPLRVRRLAMALAGEGEELPALPSMRLAGLKVLGVDDHEINRMVLADLLRLEGAQLELASSGEEALEIVEAAGPDAFQLGLLDIEMPGMDGYTLAARLRQLRPQMLLVGLTAHASQSDRAKCLAAGMNEHLSKPFDIDRLVEVIGGLIQSPAPGMETPVDDNNQNPPTGDPVMLDMDALLKRFKGRSEFVKRLLGTAVEANRDMPAKLGEAVRRKDFEELRHLAHSIKGMSGNLCAEALQQQAAEVERKASGGDGEAFQQAGRLAGKVDELVVSIRQLLES